MRWLAAILLLALYLAVAVAAGLFAPRQGLQVASASLAWGAVALAALALLHTMVAGALRARAVRRQVEEMRAIRAEADEQMAAAMAESRHLLEAVQARGGDASQRDVAAVVDEVKVLQRLIERLYQTRGGTAPPAARSAASVVTAAGSDEHAPVVSPADVTEPMVPTPTPEDAPGARIEPVLPEKSRSGAPVADVLDEAAVLDIVRDALRADRVDVYLQPIVSLPQRKNRYFECFTRIRDANGALVVPDQYLPLAVREGLISAVDNILLFRTVQLVRRTQQRRRNIGFFCNVSPHTANDAEFFDEFVAFMSENADLAPNLVFEFAQADIDQLDETGVKRLRELGELGFRFSLDQLRRLDLDYEDLARRYFRFVKVEAGVMMRHLREGGHEDIRALKRHLDSHGIDMIVEKVEDEQSLVELLDYAIDFGQGFHFGEPRLAREA